MGPANFHMEKSVCLSGVRVLGVSAKASGVEDAVMILADNTHSGRRHLENL